MSSALSLAVPEPNPVDPPLGTTTAAMWELDIDSGVLRWERQAADIWGVTSDEALPTSTASLIEAVHPADRAALSRAFVELREIGSLDVGVRLGNERTLRHLVLRGRAIDARSAHESVRAVGLILDITTERALEEELRRVSVSDALTGVLNRRGFDSSLASEWRRCTRAGQPISVLMIDIDLFKRFNDLYGHILGDEALVAVSRALSDSLFREGDHLARYGGEEFAVVLPDVDRSGALRVAGRLRDAVAALELSQVPAWRFHVSVGVASWLPEHGPVQARDLAVHADLALSMAKAAGRDQVQVAELVGDAESR